MAAIIRDCRNGRLLEQDSADFSTDYKQLHENLIKDEAEDEEEEKDTQGLFKVDNSVDS